ncbi:MAG: hypothetical protein GY861_03285 [bacterium]|nr:hypothetical protein [bacterium]
MSFDHNVEIKVGCALKIEGTLDFDNEDDGMNIDFPDNAFTARQMQRLISLVKLFKNINKDCDGIIKIKVSRKP